MNVCTIYNFYIFYLYDLLNIHYTEYHGVMFSQRTIKRASTPSGTSRRSPTTPCPSPGMSTRRLRYRSYRELPTILHSDAGILLVTLLTEAEDELIWGLCAELNKVQVVHWSH